MNSMASVGSRTGSWAGEERRKAEGVGHPEANAKRVGELVSRYGLAVIFLWAGLLKFTAYEAKNIEPMVMNSPIWSWALQSMGLRGLSNVIGIIEISIGLLIATRAFWPSLSAVGSVGAIVTFVITLSFMLTTPGVWEPGYGFGFLSALPGQFLAKDIVLLGVSISTAGEALHAARIDGQTSKHSDLQLSR